MPKPTKKTDLQIIWKDPNSLKPYPLNARFHSPEAIEEVAHQIDLVGWDVPIVIDAKDVIVKGHKRQLAAISRKIPLVPCIVSRAPEWALRAARIADNKTTENSPWISENLKTEFEALTTQNISAADLAFDAQEFQAILGGWEGINDRPAVPSTIGKEEEDEIYTKKIEPPIYEPKGEKPSVESLVDLSKTETLLEEINASEIPENIKIFLRHAASRHSVFNYQMIAEYYAHSSKQIQDFMEKSALVIIDFEKAIENGFVALSDSFAEAYL